MFGGGPCREARTDQIPALIDSWALLDGLVRYGTYAPFDIRIPL